MELNLNINLQILIAFTLSVFITTSLIPSIVKIAKIKNLMAHPNGRTSHKGAIPSLGGFAIFGAILMTNLLLLNFDSDPGLKYYLLSIIIVFAIGLKDDIIVVDPWKKLMSQILVSSILIFGAGVKFSSLHGFLGIHEIDLFTSFILTTFTIIVITNSFNLIDGIDGLASGIGIICLSVFGAWFYAIGNSNLAILAVSLAAGYLSFFFFNISKGKNKIFMGDGGSLLLGFSLAYMAIQFNELNLAQSDDLFIQSAPAVTIGTLIIPLFDTLRIFFIRLKKGKSPFCADKNHIHHNILNLTKSHLKTAIIIFVANIAFISFSFSLQSIGILSLTFSLLILAILVSYIPYRLNKEQRHSKQKVKLNYVSILRLFTMFFR